MAVPAIRAAEVHPILVEIVQGKRSLALANPACNWLEAFAGDVEFIAGDWRLTFFNDCNELDYLDSAVSPDGRRSEYIDWSEEIYPISNPLDLMSYAEQVTLQCLLEKANG